MTLNWSEVSAILGGTFDPPHLGHREAVRGLFENPGVRRVIVIPTGVPPLKPGVTPAEHRLRMTELTFAGLERFGEVKMDHRELKRPGKPSYTIDTLLELGSEIPKLAFVLGTDQLPELHRWHRFPELLQAAHWIVLQRKGGPETAMRTFAEWEASGLIRREREARDDNGEWAITGKSTRMKLVSTPAPALSSTEIREEIARSSDMEALKNSLQSQLAPSVLGYLMEHRVYGMSGN